MFLESREIVQGSPFSLLWLESCKGAVKQVFFIESLFLNHQLLDMNDISMRETIKKHNLHYYYY